MIGVIDLFSGAGGFAYGFLKAGFTILAGLEKKAEPMETYMYNINPRYMFKVDIRYLDAFYLKRVIGANIDVVIASPPCEAFTLASRNIMEDPVDRLYTDPRGRLTLDAIRIIGDIKPKIFIIENVPGITKKPIPEYIKMEFERYGFDKIYFNRLNAADYCTPSFRRRVFISNVRIKPVKCRRNISVGEAIGDLPDPRYPNEIPNHFYIPLPKRFRGKVSRVRWGEALDFYRGGGYREFKQYIRLHPKKLAPTVMGKSRFLHPYEDRLLTVREEARLMGYPDGFIFYGGVDEQYNQVGESVPPTLSYAIAKYIIERYSDILHA